MKSLKASEMGLPTKIFEYQACGKPIIACSNGEPAHYIRSTNSGIVVQPKDSIGLADSIIKLYFDKI